MKKLLIPLLTVCLFVGCSTKQANYPKSDMTHYEGFQDDEHVFVDMTVEDFVQEMHNNSSFVIYFGFAQCPWCKVAMPILNEVAKSHDISVGYIDTRKNPEAKSNLDLEDYDQLVEEIGEYLPYDSDGIRHLYTPFVVFVKDGKVVSTHQGTLPTQEDPAIPLTTEEIELLSSIYEEGIKQIK